MKRIETAIYEEMPEHPGYLKQIGMRTVKEVFRELEEELKKQELFPDEYLLLNFKIDDEKTEMPDFSRVYSYAQWGGNEGIYLDVDLDVYDEKRKAYRCVHFVTGKTLREDSEAFDRMQYIAGYIYKLLTGEHQMPARYMITCNRCGDEKDLRAELMQRVQREYLEYVRFNLVHRQDNYYEAAAGIGLRSMIVVELPKCLLAEEKLRELLDSENALDLLTKICGHIMEADRFEINDAISACSSICGEAEKSCGQDE